MLFIGLLLIINICNAQSRCGSTLAACSFVFDSTTKNLAINGNGAMLDFGMTTYPWYGLRNDILTVTISGVTKIGEGAFCACKYMKSVQIPETVITIGSRSFYECTSLESVIIPNSVTYIAVEAFMFCSSLKTITLPNKLTQITPCVFYGCISLESVTIPETVTSIGDGAFVQCSTLKSITIPNGVTFIGSRAFYLCSNLTSITIPDSVTSTGVEVFMYCTSLKSAIVSRGMTVIQACLFAECPSLETVTIPDTVNYLHDWAFTRCFSLKSIRDGIHHFGRYSLSGTAIERLVIGNGKEDDLHVYVSEGTFANCPKLKSVIIKPRFKYNPNNSSTPSCLIQKHAFDNCRNIETFIIEGYVDEVKEYAFTFNENNQVIFQYHSPSPPEICSSPDLNNSSMLLPIFSKTKSRLIYVPMNYQSTVFCSCDKLGCPIEYVENDFQDEIQKVSVPILKTLNSNFNVSYCKHEEGSEIHYVSNTSSCLSYPNSYFGYFYKMDDLVGYSKVVINVTDIYQMFVVGNSTNPLVANDFVINSEQQITNFAHFIFHYLENDFPLTINTNHTITNFVFQFFMGNSPTRIYGNVDGLKIITFNDKNYNLKRQRTFFGNATNSTSIFHLDISSFYFDYGISSYGDKFLSTSSNIVKVSCGGMHRYYSVGLNEIQINSITSTCNKSFSENDDDDFDSFIVTVKLNLFFNYQNIFLSSANTIVESIIDGYVQIISTYPNMYYKYNSTSNTNIILQGVGERKDLIIVNFNVISKTLESSTSIMEFQSEDKTLSTYIIATSKQISNFALTTFTETETVKSQILLIGLENQEIETTNGICETVIKNSSFEQCYSCKEGFYLLNSTCSNETLKCSKTQQSKCVSCNYGYYVSNGICQEVTSLNLNCSNLVSNTYCSECKEFYYSKEGICELKDVNCLEYGNGICLKCQFGYQLINNKCEKGIDSHCYYEKDKCIECSDDYTLNGNSCIVKENKNGINEIIYCNDGYYNENGICNQCINSIYCTINKQFKCPEGYYNDNNTCISKTCEMNEIKDGNGKCGIEIKNCKDNLIVNGRCVECENEYYPNINGECVTSEIQNCIYQNSFGCKRCSDGYYLDFNLQCQECSSECVTCIKSSNLCLSCENGKYLSYHKCFEDTELIEKCKQILLDGSGCAICKTGYYREGKGCEPCLTTCQTCNRNTTCLECKDGYFMKNGGQCKSINETEGCLVEIDKQTGCDRCKDGYYKIDNECYKCQTPCLSCSNDKECNTCIDEYVIDNKQCFSYHQISHCVDTKESKCSECSFWYQPSSDGTYCESHAVWWMIVLIVLVILLIIGMFVIGIYYFTNYLIKIVNRIKFEKRLGIFEINEKRVELLSVGQGLLVSTKSINFGNGKNIAVNQPVEESLIVANKGKGLLEIKISKKEKVDKYSIKSEPQEVVLKKNQAVEMKIIFNFICTCKVESNFLIVCTTRKNFKFMKEIKFNAISEISMRLDYDEIKEEKKIGEGSFGVVYLGTFRGNKVAIKKLKKMNQNKMKEFKDEVSMLDKFRSEYIIHFYGACFILNKICMITEYAEFGSFNDLKQNQNVTNVTMKLRIKMMIDSAKGIEYLHSNGILHRDIKPDNIVVTSIHLEDPVNAKLTDFGSSRNINMLMTNMTFTKGIGTPAFMAPEVLNRQKYKTAADIYSFAITMYECFGWCETYPKSIFEFSWNVADFITSGKRRTKPDNMTNEQYQLIEQCWKQEPKERLKIDEVIENLQKFFEANVN